MNKELKVTNPKIQIPPFEGWGNHTEWQWANHFVCDEMIFAEPIKDGTVTLNGVTFKVIPIGDDGDDNLLGGGSLPAKLELV